MRALCFKGSMYGYAMKFSVKPGEKADMMKLAAEIAKMF